MSGSGKRVVASHDGIGDLTPNHVLVTIELSSAFTGFSENGSGLAAATVVAHRLVWDGARAIQLRVEPMDEVVPRAIDRPRYTDRVPCRGFHYVQRFGEIVWFTQLLRIELVSRVVDEV